MRSGGTDWAQTLKRDVITLYLAARDPRVPWLAKALAALVAAYALSPIDLIPDFIPVLGLLDDVILVPIGVFFVMKLVPKPLLAEIRQTAEQRAAEPGASRIGAVIVVVIWLLIAVGLALLLLGPGASDRASA